MTGVLIGMLVVVYLFLGGCGAGTLAVISAWSALFYRREDRDWSITEAFGRLKLRCYFAGFVITLGSSALLLLDLGRPELFFLLFLKPTFSPISLGSFFLLAAIVLAALLVVANAIVDDPVPSLVKKVLEVLCVLASLAVMLYTGVFLQGVEAVALWASPFVPALFLFSSLSSGFAVVLLVASVSDDGYYLVREFGGFHWAHAVVLVAEIAALAMFLLRALFDPAAADSVALLLGPEIGSWLLVGVVLLGMLVPLVTECVLIRTGGSGNVLVLGTSCLIGGFLLRYCLVAAGLH